LRRGFSPAVAKRRKKKASPLVLQKEAKSGAAGARGKVIGAGRR